MRWLISLDGSPRADSAAQFAAELLQPGKDEVVLLGIAARESSLKKLEKSLAALNQSLGALVSEQLIHFGSTAEVIEKVAGSGSFDIALYGSRGRRGLTKVLFGSVAARLAHAISCSLLVVRKTPEPVKRILICSTLDPFHTAPMEIGKNLAQAVTADVTILHVMSQIPLIDQASLDQLELTAEEAIARRTREGQALLDAQQELQAAGLQTHSVIRHGLVIDEILDEVVSGDYDLLVIGSHAGPRTSRWQDILVEDITNTVLLDTRCPVLIVRERKAN